MKRPDAFELVGSLAEHAFNSVNIGTAFLSVDGLSALAGATTYDYTEAKTQRAMVFRAQRTVVVTEGSKIGDVALANVVPAESMDDLITDSRADPAQLQAFTEMGVHVHVVDDILGDVPADPSPSVQCDSATWED